MTPYYEIELGKLYHGDCLEIMPQLEPVDLVLTDPPYNAGKDYGTYKDNLSEKEYLLFMSKVFKMMLAVSQNNIAVYMDSHRFKSFWDMLPAARPIFLHITANGFGNSQKIRQDHHVILTTAKSSNSTSSIWQGIRVLREGYFFREKKTGHPCQTTLAGMKKFLGFFSGGGDIILDPFSGSATTAIACECLNRRWIGIEIEEKWCKVAAKRIEQERKQRKLF